MFKLYYQLTKPGIIYGNAITALAGFFLASRGHLNFRLLIATLVGLSLVIGSGCVFNNIWDRDLDAKMQRTKNRAMVTRTISPRSAMIFGLILLVVGLLALHYYTNDTALFAALIGFLVYVFAYTPLKRRSVYATLVGSIAGATPPVVGYAAVTNRFDAAALVLFLILVCWQMPHFYAIAIYRLKDYAAAGVPVLPVKAGIHDSKIQMLWYIVGFVIASLSLALTGFAGYNYGIFACVLGLAWLWLGGLGFRVSDETAWARKMFLFSLLVLMSLCVIISLDFIIH